MVPTTPRCRGLRASPRGSQVGEGYGCNQRSETADHDLRSGRPRRRAIMFGQKRGRSSRPPQAQADPVPVCGLADHGGRPAHRASMAAGPGGTTPTAARRAGMAEGGRGGVAAAPGSPRRAGEGPHCRAGCRQRQNETRSRGGGEGAAVAAAPVDPRRDASTTASSTKPNPGTPRVAWWPRCSGTKASYSRASGSS
jgi:hypothetical protein